MKKMPLLAKGTVLMALALLLLIPLGMIEGAISERMGRLHQVEADIANSTAQPQTVLGPLVVLHYTEHWVDKVVEQKRDGDKRWSEAKAVPRHASRYQYIFPSQLNADGRLSVEVRQRGAFATQVYSVAGNLRGRIELPALQTLSEKTGGRIELNSARAVVVISDRKGFLSRPQLSLGQRQYAFKPGSRLPGWDAGIHADIASALPEQSEVFDFEIPLLLQGTQRLGWVPLADDNQLAMTGDWPHPSFDGDFLPVQRTLEDAGFDASWRVTSLASSAQSRVRMQLGSGEFDMRGVQCLGVSLAAPVSIYSSTDRALKYGFLFVGLTFASFFLYELLMRLKIHPVQYTLVGVAQALFFLLLLSLSEHLGFGRAYAVAMLGAVGLIGCYLSSVLCSRVRGLGFGGALAVLYGVLYLLLQSADYALLGGSLVLFGLLAGAMMITRKLDWYRLENQRVDKPALQPAAPPEPGG